MRVFVVNPSSRDDSRHTFRYKLAASATVGRLITQEEIPHGMIFVVGVSVDFINATIRLLYEYLRVLRTRVSAVHHT